MSDDELGDGVKVLTLENWLLPDEASSFLVGLDPEGAEVRLDGSAWAARFLSIRVGDATPQNIREMFVAARGAFLYGYFYYPIDALAEDFLGRVAEIAVAGAYEGPQDEWRRAHGSTHRWPG